MPNAHISDKTVVSPNILAFKPRQVLLLRQSPRAITPRTKQTSTTLNLMTKQESNGGNTTLSPSQRDSLVRSVARFLQRSGFSKTLKKLRSEAKFQEDNFEDCLFDLEVVLLKYLEICGDGSKDNGSNKEPVCTGAKLNEKKNGEPLGQVVALEASPKKDKKKEKKQKREKNKLSGEQVDEQKQDEALKLKKREDHSIQESLSNGISDVVWAGKPKTAEHVIIKQVAPSKKRKKHDSVKDDPQACEEKAIGESKRRKIAIPEEAKSSKKAMKTTSSLEGDETVQLDKDSNQSINVSSKQIDGHANGDLKENGEKSIETKSMKKAKKGSAEPTSVKRFQRVNAEEIVISNEKLQNNSYWAKDGAETGYGAKAEEILSQVRGRGFRHEKTKKKRGTYRGGQIDVHSHSVKFNYSDEE